MIPRKNKRNQKPVPRARRTLPLGAEIKYRDLGITSTTFTNAETSTLPTYYQIDTLCNLIRGDENENREGSKILAKSLEICGVVIVDKNSNASWTNLVNSDHVFRVVIYQDKQCNGAVANIASIFETAGVTGNLFNAGCQRNLDFIARFKILHDSMHRIDVPASTWDGTQFHFPGSIVPFKISLNLGLSPIFYQNNSDTVADLTSNNYGMIIMLTTSATTQRKLTWRSRFTFYDY